MTASINVMIPGEQTPFLKAATAISNSRASPREKQCKPPTATPGFVSSTKGGNQRSLRERVCSVLLVISWLFSSFPPSPAADSRNRIAGIQYTGFLAVLYEIS